MKLGKFASALGLLSLLTTQAGAQNGYVLGIGAPNLPSVAGAYDLTVDYDLSGLGGPYLVNLAPGSNSSSQVQALALNPAVTSLEADTAAASSETTPSSKAQSVIDQLKGALAAGTLVPFYGGMVRSAYVQQTVSSILELPAAQQITTGAGIVAVIDTGVDPYHPALAGALVPGYDFTRNQATVPNEMDDLDPIGLAAMTNSGQVPESGKTQGLQLQGSTVVILDGSTVAILDGATLPTAFGHGTMTAGLIHLVAPTASIMPLKAFKADGSANLSDIVRAIYFAVNNGARVINMSFDIEIQSPQLQDAIAYATSNGVICVAAAGNDGEMELTYPAALSRVIGVGSTSNTDRRSAFSNFGTASVLMAAPGEGLITPFPGSNYAGVWGTSFSAALVSGAVADLLQLNPQASYDETLQALGAGPRLCQQQLGRDRLDVLSSVNALLEDDE